MPGRSLGVFVTVEWSPTAVALVIGASLLARSLAVQLSVDVGFQRRFSGSQRRSHRRLRVIRTIPPDETSTRRWSGVCAPFRSFAGVGLSTVFEPFGAAAVGGSVFLIGGDGRTRPRKAESGPGRTCERAVSSDYLNTLGVSMVAGRPFTEDDVAGAQRVVLVSERLAEAWWPGTSAVGRRIRFPGSENEADPWRTVVGVVADVRWQGAAARESTTLYLPLAQHVRRHRRDVPGRAVERRFPAESRRVCKP